MKQRNIGIVTLPGAASGDIPLSNFTKIVSQLSDNVYLITGQLNIDVQYKLQYNPKNVEIITINYNSEKNIIKRIVCFLILQMKYALQIIKLNRYVKCWIFFFAERGPLLPLFIAKLMKKYTIIVFGGSVKNIIRNRAKQKSFFDVIMIFFERCVCLLSKNIIVYSESLIKEWDLEKYKNKIIVSHRHFLDFTNFKIMNKYNCRRKIIGYVGRLSGEKGVLNFIEAMPLVQECDFIIIGDGNLRSEITEYIFKKNLSNKVKLTGWIPHDKLPNYLNELKLLILPSYTEGLPNIMLEAMACGTPVLATKVGAIPDIIKDGETGFFLEDNSPECIAKSILNILNMPDEKLEQVSESARKFVEDEFTFEKVAARWGQILSNL